MLNRLHLWLIGVLAGDDLAVMINCRVVDGVITISHEHMLITRNVFVRTSIWSEFGYERWLDRKQDELNRELVNIECGEASDEHR